MEGDGWRDRERGGGRKGEEGGRARGWKEGRGEGEERRVEEMDGGKGKEEEEGRGGKGENEGRDRERKGEILYCMHGIYFHPPYCSLWNQLLLFLEVLVRVEEHLVTIRPVP